MCVRVDGLEDLKQEHSWRFGDRNWTRTSSGRAGDLRVALSQRLDFRAPMASDRAARWGGTAVGMPAWRPRTRSCAGRRARTCRGLGVRSARRGEVRAGRSSHAALGGPALERGRCAADLVLRVVAVAVVVVVAVAVAVVWVRGAELRLRSGLGSPELEAALL